MSINNRLKKNRNDQVFIPMNIDGYSIEDNFVNSRKLITLMIMVVFSIIYIAWASSLYLSLIGAVIVYGVLVVIDVYFLRFFVFEEKYYHRMYKKLKNNEITTPALFWDVSSIRDTEEGAVITYFDLKVAVVVKMSRDTITGKHEDFEEVHFEALSNFYKELNKKGLQYVQLDIMEQAGKDERLSKLDELVTKDDNPNVVRILEVMVGHIKNITRVTLFETDYFLIYSEDIRKADSLITEALNCVYKLLDGAFLSFKVLNSEEIYELQKEEYQVKYFDEAEAYVTRFKNRSRKTAAVKVTRIKFNDGTEVECSDRENNRLRKEVSNSLRGVLSGRSVKEILKDKKNVNDSKNNSYFYGGIDYNAMIENEDNVSGYIVDFDEELAGEDSQEYIDF